MANPKKINLRVLLVALALLACGTMALGGTFATGINKDDAREDLSTDNIFEYKNIHLNYFNPQTGKYDLDFLNSAALTNAPWCPGYTQIVYLAVENDEAFPVECTLQMNVTEADSDVEVDLDEVMTYAVIADLQNSTANHYPNWKMFLSTMGIDATPLKTGSHYIFNNILLASAQTRYYALAIHMDEDASNKYQEQKLAIKFTFSVNANSRTTSAD